MEEALEDASPRSLQSVGWFGVQFLFALHLDLTYYVTVQYYNGYQGVHKTTGQTLTLNDTGDKPEERTLIFPYPADVAYTLGMPLHQIIHHFKTFPSATSFTDKTYVFPEL